MSGGDFKLTESTRAVLPASAGPCSSISSTAAETVGKRFLYTLEEAAELGEQIVNTGTWDESPVNGISTSELRRFGERLRDYGINGC